MSQPLNHSVLRELKEAAEWKEFSYSWGRVWQSFHIKHGAPQLLWPSSAEQRLHESSCWRGKKIFFFSATTWSIFCSSRNTLFDLSVGLIHFWAEKSLIFNIRTLFLEFNLPFVNWNPFCTNNDELGNICPFFSLQQFDSEVCVSWGLKGTLNWGMNREKGALPWDGLI